MSKFITRYFARIVPECDPTTTCDTNALLLLVANILNFFIKIALIAAVISVMWGGVLMLTSGGSSSRISTGKKAITAAVIGIIIVTVSVSLINGFLGLFTDCQLQWLSFTNALDCSGS